MNRHHPSCPDDAHTHHVGPTLLAYTGHVVFVGRDTVIACIERSVAERVAELINAHGLADVPDHLPDELVWGAPCPDDRLVDFRLPEDPNAP